MAKQLNGIFRAWTKVKQADERAPPIIWGHCVVHLSHPEFSGKVLHTSGVLDITDTKTFKIAETRNNYYALLGPELAMPGPGVEPMDYVMRHSEPPPETDAYVIAALNADRDCPKCHGTGVYRSGDRLAAICDACCKHVQGWWQLEGAYGPDNGRWACKAGCGVIVDTPIPDLEFLPRALV
jgi:hypothetical protein